jgi:serine/threonine protein kinase
LQFLQNIGGGVVNTDQMMNTVIEELRLMKICLESGKGPATKPKQIAQSELMDPIIVDDTDYYGTNKKIKKCYKTTINVACIPIKLNKITGKGPIQIDKQLAILSKLSECTNILKFYGLADLDHLDCLIVEWTQYGTLKEIYEAYDIPWTRKLYIVTDICRAITFLHSAEIYHRDLRCENVMLTDHLEPKLANFEYSRALEANYDLAKVHWSSPERLIGERYKYNNFKCEIFRYSFNLVYYTFKTG